MTPTPAGAGPSRLPKAALLFLLLLLGTAGAYVGSVLLWADPSVLRDPTGTDLLHPAAVFNAVLTLVLAYSASAAWLGHRWTHDDVEALRPVIDAGEVEWARWLGEVRRPPPGPLLRAALLGALGGAAINGISLAIGTWDPTTWVGHRIWSWILNPTLFAVLGVLAWVSASGNRVFDALGRHARVRVGERTGLTPFARAGLRRALLWLLGSSLAALLLPTAGTPDIVLAVIVGTVGMGVLSLFAPSRTLHVRMRERKQAELAWVRAEIARAGDALRGHGDPARGLRLPALIAWEARVAAAPEWPFDVSTRLRFALLLLVPLGSWLGGALVELVVDRWLGG